MKRSGFRQRSLEEIIMQQAIKRAKPKVKKVKKKKPKISIIKNKLWEECKRLVRATYVKEDGSWDCFTCDKRITNPADAHTAHFIPSAACGAFLRYDLRNLRVCCYHCNINLGGNGSEYYRRLVEKNGQDYVDQLFLDKQKTIKADFFFYESKFNQYRSMETCTGT
jgi:hypothetical protein